MEAGMHKPVLLKETIEVLGVKPGGRYVDGTLGRAGHAREILRKGGLVLGIDRDDQALREVSQLAKAGEGLEGLKVVKGNHGRLAEIARENGWAYADGVLLDLGVSSPQLDEAGRGFSFRRNGPLDMRMDRSQGLTAADLVNTQSAERLEEIFRKWGEEPQARRIAGAIVRERGPRPFRTTHQLADFVEFVVTVPAEEAGGGDAVVRRHDLIEHVLQTAAHAVLGTNAADQVDVGSAVRFRLGHHFFYRHHGSYLPPLSLLR